ncbi:MAG: hypothetical protein V1674_03860 [Candidatus Omnitrophota bacterium]
MEELIGYLLKALGLILGAIGIIIGLGLLVAPKTVIKVNNILNKRFSIEGIREKLEKEIDTTGLFLKANIVIGVVTLIVSLLLVLTIRRF